MTQAIRDYLDVVLRRINSCSQNDRSAPIVRLSEANGEVADQLNGEIIVTSQDRSNGRVIEFRETLMGITSTSDVDDRLASVLSRFLAAVTDRGTKPGKKAL